jgi:hypothetical protein
MKYIHTMMLAGIVLIASCTPQNKEETQSRDWLNLITSNELEGWDKIGAFNTKFSDNALMLTGQQQDGWLIFDEEYEDFLLQTEFLLGAGNAGGIAFRYPEAKKGDPTYTGYKVTLDHNLDQQNPTGSIYNVARAKWLKSTKVDDWNKIAIEARGDHLKVMINDTLVAEVHDRRSEEGLISLEVKKASKIQFRNLRVKALEEVEYLGPQVEDYMRSYDQSAMMPLIGDNLDDWSKMGEASWDLNNGVIHGYSNEKGGFLVSKDAYQNFYLRLKFKIIHEDNSGIFIRQDPEAVDEITTDNAIECNIYDHDGYLHEYSTGSIAGHARSWSKMIDYEDWNDMEIFAFEDQIMMYVNGRKSSESHLPEKFNQKGNICIQGGIQVFSGNGPSNIYIKDMYLKNFDEIQFLGY